MNSPLTWLTVLGGCGLSISAYKMYQTNFPEELRGIRLPLKAKEAVVKSLLSRECEKKLAYIEEAKNIIGKRYGYVSPEYNRLLCYEADVAIMKMCDCDLKTKLLLEVIQKAHVGEGVEEEVSRWMSAYKLLDHLSASCRDHIESREAVDKAKLQMSRLPDNIKRRVQGDPC